jgi:hypothetical protein
MTIRVAMGPQDSNTPLIAFFPSLGYHGGTTTLHVLHA